MKKLMALRGTEPVRLILWPVIGVLVAYGVQRGIVTGDVVAFVLPVLAVVLGVPVTAAIRSQVTPVAAANRVVATVVNDSVTAVRQQLASELGEGSTQIADRVTALITEYTGRHRSA